MYLFVYMNECINVCMCFLSNFICMWMKLSILECMYLNDHMYIRKYNVCE